MEKHKISIFGTSAAYIHYLMVLGVKPDGNHDLSTLREISHPWNGCS